MRSPRRISSVDTIKYAFIFTGAGMVIIYGLVLPGLLVAGIGAVIAWAQHDDNES